MSILAATGLTASTLLQLLAGALGAGLGVTAAFSSLIYCVERASELRRAGRQGAAVAFSTAAGLAAVLCLGLVVAGLLLVVAKPK